MKWWQKVSQNFNPDGIRLFVYIVGVSSANHRQSVPECCAGCLHIHSQTAVLYQAVTESEGLGMVCAILVLFSCHISFVQACVLRLQPDMHHDAGPS